MGRPFYKKRKTLDYDILSNVISGEKQPVQSKKKQKGSAHSDYQRMIKTVRYNPNYKKNKKEKKKNKNKNQDVKPEKKIKRKRKRPKKSNAQHERDLDDLTQLKNPKKRKFFTATMVDDESDIEDDLDEKLYYQSKNDRYKDENEESENDDDDNIYLNQEDFEDNVIDRDDEIIANMERKLGITKANKRAEKKEAALAEQTKDEEYEAFLAEKRGQQTMEDEYSVEDAYDEDEDPLNQLTEGLGDSDDEQMDEEYDGQSMEDDDDTVFVEETKEEGLNQQYIEDNSNMFVTEPETHMKDEVPEALYTNSLKDMDRSSERYQELQKYVRNTLNKISPQNFELMMDEVITMYRSSSANEFNDVLANFLLSSLLDEVQLKSSFIMVYASFLASLHFTTKRHIAAHCIEAIVKNYHQSLHENKSSKSQLLAILMFMAHCYNFDLIDSQLISDIVEDLFTIASDALHYELLFKFMNSVGGQLRERNMKFFKSLNHGFKTRYESLVGSATISQRCKTFASLLADLRSKDMDRERESYRMLKKLIHQVNQKYHVAAQAADKMLYIKLEDYLSSDERGRWWVTGQAWQQQSTPVQKQEVKKDESVDSVLEKLAQKHHMNTDIRRQLFLTLLQGDSSVHAADEIGKTMNLKQHGKEIIRVTMYVASCVERSFNSYYPDMLAILVQRFPKHFDGQLKFVVYERLEDIGSWSRKSRIRFGQFLAALLERSAMVLANFKSFELLFDSEDDLKPVFDALWMHLLCHCEEESLVAIFLRTVVNENCSDFKQQLRLYWQLNYLNPIKREEMLSTYLKRIFHKRSDEMVTSAFFKRRVKIVKKVLAYVPKAIQEDDPSV